MPIPEDFRKAFNIPEEPVELPTKIPTEIPTDLEKPTFPIEFTEAFKKEETPWLVKRGSELLGGAYEGLGRATGLPVFEDIGKKIKESPGYIGTMKALYGEYADIPTQLVRGITWDYTPAIETPVEASMGRKAVAGAAHLFGMGLGLLPVSRVARVAIPAVGAVAGVVRGAATGAIYGLGAKPAEEETRLGNIAKYALMFGAFEGGGGLLETLSKKIPMVRSTFDKIKIGESLTPQEKTIQSVVDYGRSALLGAGAGAIEPAETWEERAKHMIAGALTFGMAHFGHNIFSGALSEIKAKETKLPVGAKLDIEKALTDPTIPPEQRRIAATLLKRTAGRKLPKSLDLDIWDTYIDDCVINNKIISPEGFDSFISNMKLKTIKEKVLMDEDIPQKEYETIYKIGALTPEELKSLEEVKLQTAIFQAENNKMVSKEGMTLLEQYRPELAQKTAIFYKPEIEIKPAIEPREPIDIAEVMKIKGKEEITLKEALPEEMLRRKAERIAKGEDVPLAVKIETLEKPEHVKREPVIADIEPTVLDEEIAKEETLKTKSEQAKKIQNETAKNGTLFSNFKINDITIEEFGEELSKGNITIVNEAQKAFDKAETIEEIKLLDHYIITQSNYENLRARNISHEEQKAYNQRAKPVMDKILKIQRDRLEILLKNKPAEKGDITSSEIKISDATNRVVQDISKFRNLNENIIKELLPAYEQGKMNFKEMEMNLRRRGITTDLEVENYQRGIEDISNNQWRRISGGLSIPELQERGKRFLQEGKTTLEQFKNAFKEDLGEEFSKYKRQLDSIYKTLRTNEIRENSNIGGYEINGQRVGNQSNDWHKKAQSFVKDEFGGIKDKTVSFVNKNIERANDFLSNVPKTEQEKLVDKLSKNIGWGRYTLDKLEKWIKVPLWDKGLEPIVKNLKNLTRKATTISNEFLMKLDFIKKEPLTQREIDAIIETNLTQKTDHWKNLTSHERERIGKVFDTTRWMREKFKEEMVANKENYLTIAKREGYDNVDEWIKDKIEKEMAYHYYVPMTRAKGNYVVFVRDRQNKESLWSENFQSKSDAQKRALELTKQFPSDELIMFDARDRYGFEFSKVLEMIHDLPYLKNMLRGKQISEERIKELQDLLSGRYLERWAKGRLALRKGVPGFSRDIQEVLNDYAFYFPRSFIRRFNADKIAQFVMQVPENKQIYADNLVDYYMGRQDHEGKWNFLIRNIIFNWNLGLKPSFAILNLSQRGTTTVWRAIKEQGIEGAHLALKAQYKEIAFYRELIGKRMKGLRRKEIIEQSNVLSKEDKEIVIKMFENGDLETLRNLEIIGNNKISRLLNVFSTTSELSNRFHSTLTGIEIGKLRGLSGDALFDYATDFTHRTQWLYGKENRPIVGRGWRAPLFVFKSFVLNDLNFLKDMYPNKTAFAGAIATRLALGGFGGMYGVDTFMDAFNWAMINIVGKKDWELAKKETEAMMRDKYGKGLIDIMTKGLPSIANIEGSVTFGAGNFFDLAGIPLVEGTYKNLKTFLEKEGIDKDEFIRRNAPPIVKHMMGFSTKTIFGKPRLSIEDIKRLPPEIRRRAYEMYKLMPKGYSEKEKTLYLLGFSTTSVSDFYEAINAIRVTGMKVREEKAGIHREIAKAMEEQRHEDMKNLIEDARKRGIKLNQTAILKQLGMYKEAETLQEEVEEMEE